MKPIRKAQRNEQTCYGCDGAGITQDEDYDEHGRRLVNVRCEMCDGCCVLVDCNACDEPTPPSILELNSGYCGACAAAREIGDAAFEAARHRRAS